MSPTTQMSAPPAVYIPTSDAMDRHEYGISKNRKTASTGGGRAWSEDEVRDLVKGLGWWRRTLFESCFEREDKESRPTSRMMKLSSY